MAWAVDVSMAQAKRVYILIFKNNKFFFPFFRRGVLRVPMEIKINTRETLGDPEKAVETLA